jgi:TolB protein
MNQNRRLMLAAGLLLTCGFLFFATMVLLGLTRLAKPTSMPTSNLPATLAALTPLSNGSRAFTTSTLEPASPAGTSQTTAAIPSNEPSGKIVFTCQIFKVQASNQICMIHADGSGFRRLTTEDGRQHYYASLSPDGKSVIYAAFREKNIYEIYEMNLADGSVKQLTDRLGVLNSPEISPDESLIVFMRWTAASDQYQVWVMDRNGENARRVFGGSGWDPTWSPDGKQILFASDRNGSSQLWIGNLNGSGLTQVRHLPDLRGRSDWSPQNQIITYSGAAWGREIIAMNVDGSNKHQISPAGGNSQGPAFSPDGQWVAFTAYFDKIGDIHGCEIYIMRADGSDLRRLTNNDYCDYQPRWGP